MRPASWIALLAALAAAPAGAEPATGRIEGRVQLSLEGHTLRDVAPVVVYLDGRDGPLEFRAPEAVATVRQREARFVPRFLAVVVGQEVEMPNDDLIYHNVFSYSEPNDFDLGLYPAGESRSVRLHQAGVVKTYCSIHEKMNGTIFVAPSPWFEVTDDSGRFALEAVPPGSYRLFAWSERLPRAEIRVDLARGQRRSVELWLGGAPRPQPRREASSAGSAGDTR